MPLCTGIDGVADLAAAIATTFDPIVYDEGRTPDLEELAREYTMTETHHMELCAH